MTEAYPANGSPPPAPRRVPPPPGALLLGHGAWVRPQDLDWSFTTARGPGGQHVNKASTAAVLRVAIADLGGLDEPARERLLAMSGAALVGGDSLLFRCDLHRSQLMNREACEARLKVLVSGAAIRPKVRKKTKPTWGSVQRRLEGKKREADKKRSRNWKND